VGANLGKCSKRMARWSVRKRGRKGGPRSATFGGRAVGEVAHGKKKKWTCVGR